MIKTKNLSFEYGNITTVNNVNMNVEKGEFVAIVGANGAGKTTIIKLLRGLLKPTKGKVLVSGNDISKVRTSSLAKKIGFLFQNPDRQLCKGTVREELMFTLENAVDDKSAHEKMCNDMLKQFSMAPEDELINLSRGECQKVALASAVVSCPDILILDEPTTGLDYRECIQIMDLISKMNKNGVTVIMVCHDMEIVMKYAKRVIVMSRGEIVGDASPLGIFYDCQLLKRAALVPPQIIELSQILGESFGKVSSCDDMTHAICNKKREDEENGRIIRIYSGNYIYPQAKSNY